LSVRVFGWSPQPGHAYHQRQAREDGRHDPGEEPRHWFGRGGHRGRFGFRSRFVYFDARVGNVVQAAVPVSFQASAQ
jgi:hypothetical protein